MVNCLQETTSATFMVFGPVKKSSENVYVSLKTESNHLKINKSLKT